MKFVHYKSLLSNGNTITIQLKEPCKCRIALTAISIPNFNVRGALENAVDIFCDQIDSTFENPHRLLQRIPFNRLEKDEHFNTWTAQHIQLEKVDSDDDFLTLTIKRTINEDNLKFVKAKDPDIFITLLFMEETEPTHWNTYI